MNEYLVSYGRSGDFGRFRADETASYCRGDRVVVRTEQGLELGVVLCPAEEGHGRFLSRTAQGRLLRLCTRADENTASGMDERGQAIFEHARALVEQLALPLEVLDAEVLLDGKQVVLHHLRRDECDYRPLVSGIARAFDVRVIMQNLYVPHEPVIGCGEPNCGAGKGGCTSCSTEGGCGTCGKGHKADDVAAYLASQEASRRQSLL
jgi:cell fate regulator YaaT (PSP1 superfamily)